MIRVTYIAPFLPYKRIPHAGGQFLYHYLSELIGKVRATIIAPDLEINRMAAGSVPEGLDVHLLPLPAVATNSTNRAVRSVLRRTDGLSMGVGERGALRHDEAARRLVSASDIIELHWSETLPLIPIVKEWEPSIPIISVEHDVRYQVISGRARRAARNLDRALSAVAAIRVKRREPALLNHCDAVLTFTDKDIGLLRSLGVTVRIERLDPYLAVPSEPVGPAPGETVLFVAAFDRPENTEGARWFLDHVWPSVQTRCPDAILLLAGAHPPFDLTARATSRVHVPGFIDDLDQVYRSARVVVCPLFTGGGIKFKVPQAMLYGLPVVATTVAVDGVSVPRGTIVFGAVTDDPGVMADAVVDYLLNRDRATVVGVHARAWALEEYRFGERVERILQLYNRLAPPST